ncbi:MAG: YggS family pyridoxal phosphate-dependent enzyme [Ferruginibacter sp.]
MAINKEKYLQIISELKNKATLVAVSKTKPLGEIQALYDLGQRDFGENYVQELADKYEALPKDIRWHFIGHLQSNKVKYIASFVYLIHSVDSEKLLAEINKQGQKLKRTIDCLLQVHIAEEETKFGFDEHELKEVLNGFKVTSSANVSIRGLMGMASFSDDENKIRTEFKKLQHLYTNYSVSFSTFNLLSMGMSSDYKTGIEEGSNIVRIGSLLFGERPSQVPSSQD